MNFLLRNTIISIAFFALPLCASNKAKKTRPILGEIYPAMQDYARAMQSYNRNNDLIKLRQNFIDFLNAYPRPIKPLQMNGMVGMYAVLKDLDSNYKQALDDNGKKRLRELWDWTRNAILIETQEMILFLHETDNPVYAHVCWELMNNEQRKHFIANGHKYKAYKILSEDCAQEFGQQTKQGATTAYTKIAKEKKPQEDTPFTFLNRNFESIMSRNTTPKDRTTHLLVFLEILNTKDFPELGIADNDKAQEYEHCFAQFITMSTFKNLFGNRCTLLALYNIQKVQNRLVLQMKSMAESGIAVPSFAACRAKVTCCTQQDIDQAVLAHPNFNALITRYQAVPTATAAATAISTSQQAEQKKEKELDPLERLFSCLDTYARAITSANPVAATAQYEADFIAAINNYTTPQVVDVSLELTTIVKYFSALKHIESHDSFKPNAKKIIKELRDCYKLMIGKYYIVKLMENVQSIVEADGILELMNTTERRKFSRQGNHTRGYALLKNKYPDKFKLEVKALPPKTAAASENSGSASNAVAAFPSADANAQSKSKTNAEKIKQLNEDTANKMVFTDKQLEAFGLEEIILSHILYKDIHNSKALLTPSALKKVETIVAQTETILRRNQAFLVERLSGFNDAFAVACCWQVMTESSRNAFTQKEGWKTIRPILVQLLLREPSSSAVQQLPVDTALAAAQAQASTFTQAFMDCIAKYHNKIETNAQDKTLEINEILKFLNSGRLEFKLKAASSVIDYMNTMHESFYCFCAVNDLQAKQSLSSIAQENIKAFKSALMLSTAKPIKDLTNVESVVGEKNALSRFANLDDSVREFWHMMNEQQKQFFFYHMQGFYEFIGLNDKFPEMSAQMAKGKKEYWQAVQKEHALQSTLQSALRDPYITRDNFDTMFPSHAVNQPAKSDQNDKEVTKTVAASLNAVEAACITRLNNRLAFEPLLELAPKLGLAQDYFLFILYGAVKKVLDHKSDRLNEIGKNNGAQIAKTYGTALKEQQDLLLKVLSDCLDNDYIDYYWQLMDVDHKKEFIKNGAKAIPYKFLSEKYPEQFSHSAAAPAASSTATVVPPKVTQARKPTPQEIHETKAKQEKLAAQERDRKIKMADDFAQQQAKLNALKALKRSVKETYLSAVNNALKALRSSCKEIQEYEKAIKPARLSTLKQQVTPFGHAQDLSTILDWRNQAEFIWAAQWNRLLLQAHNAYDATRILAESHESYTELASDSQSMELIARSHALLHGIANYKFIGKDAQAMARKFMMPNQSTKHYKQKFNFVPAGEMRKFNFLLSAVRAQDKDLVDRLSQENPADLNAVNGYRAGPLFCAVGQNSDLMVKYLLFRNARVGNKALTVADTEMHNLLTTAAQKTNKELDV